MTEDCIFCKIARGEIPCATVFESDSCIAFLDIAPVSPGHTLVMPKDHFETLMDLPPELGTDLLGALGKISQAIMEVTKADGLNVIQNNHAAAGQVVPHAHFHLIPRHLGDGHELWPQQEYSNSREMTRLAEAISCKLDRV